MGKTHCFFSSMALCLVLILLSPGLLFSQPLSTDRIGDLIQGFKKDPRGPYQSIQWFCKDGTVNPANKPCPHTGGFQHALHKDIVRIIERENGIYLGQILAGTPFKEFFDEVHLNSRLKQYQMEKFLQAVDDGWILRRARYYRGAFQAENESSWGRDFLIWLLSTDETVLTQFFLIRQAVKDIPHKANNNQWRSIRALSKTISDSMPSFIDLRVKLHGQPEPEDLSRVREFYARHRDSISPELDSVFRSLEKELDTVYQPLQLKSLERFLNQIRPQFISHDQINRLIKNYSHITEQPEKKSSQYGSLCMELADLLWNIRKSLLSIPPGSSRLSTMDLSNETENLLFQLIQSWQPKTLREIFEKGYVLAKAAAGCGFMEIWEWETVEPFMAIRGDENLGIREFLEKAMYTQRVVEWCNGMSAAVYEPVVSLFKEFEPKSIGFLDDLIRSSVLLPLGDVAGQLGEISSKFSKSSNDVLGIPNQNQIRGLNPGLALGELEVMADRPDKLNFSSKKIYVMSNIPPELKPVAGIATISEGNLVSHVQLLARNLGIPNAIITKQHLKDLIPFSGTVVFYAVSPGGTVIMKPENQMTQEEKRLMGEGKRREDKVMVPTERLHLKRYEFISLNNVRASDSGRLCGPKAANLGELKNLFPDKVVNGLIIPFGVFRAHLDQPMGGTRSTLWQFLQETFTAAAKERDGGGKNDEEIERYILERLGQLRNAIKEIPFLPGFQDDLRKKFQKEFGKKMGEIPVFIRSDTNMEDLKEFTGAGLNLTVFNVVEENKIFQGIRDVWASPYTERSYLWRQKYLLNPENVFPSILILPTVNVDKSGVMITTGIPTSDPRDITVVFNRGAGGAVEGQTAESYLLQHDGRNILLSPARELFYPALPSTGGVQKTSTHLVKPILKSRDLENLRELDREVKKRLGGTTGMEPVGTLDIELGFKEDRIWLFQMRPYVESKKALSNTYLKNLDPEIPKDRRISLGDRMEDIQ